MPHANKFGNLYAFFFFFLAKFLIDESYKLRKFTHPDAESHLYNPHR